MKFGVNILNFGPGMGPSVLSRWARTAESLGYHLVMISDHVAVTDDVQAHYPVPFYEPFVTLAWLAGITKNVELGTTVAILPYRNPLVTARMGANIDQVSNGRFIFGVGVGWAKEEFEALGVPFEKRGAISDEYLSAIKEHWTKGTVSRGGRFASYTGVHTAPGPARPPPIWVGGSSDPALRRTVRFGDAWHPIHERLQLADAEAKRVPGFCPRIRLEITGKPLDEQTRLPGQGTLDQIRGDLEALGSLNAEYVLFDSYAGKPEGRRDSEADLLMFKTLAEQVLDVKREKLR